MGIAVSHPCAPSNAPESSPRCDVMSGMRELLWPDRISAIQPKRGRGTNDARIGRMTIYNAYYHILVVRDLREGNGAEHRSFWEKSAMLSRVGGGSVGYACHMNDNNGRGRRRGRGRWRRRRKNEQNGEHFRARRKGFMAPQ